MCGSSASPLGSVVARAVFLAVAFGLASTAAAGAIYFVAPSGSDSGDGTQGAPWRTIGRALSTAAAGDTVVLRAGTWNEHVIMPRSGGAGASITLTAFPGEIATLDGTGLAISEDGGVIEIVGVDHIVVSDLRIVRSPGAGVWVDGAGNIVLERLTTNDTVFSGIGVWVSHDITIADCEVILACNDGGQECITVAGTERFEVRGNHVHDGGPGTRGGEGIDAKDGSSYGTIHHNHVHDLKRVGIYVDAWDKFTHDIDVYCNNVHETANNGFDLASEMGGLLERVKLYDNLAWGNRWVGIWVGTSGDSPLHPMRDIQIINNTVVGNGTGDWGGGISVDSAEATAVVVRNNIVTGNLSFQIVVGPGVPATAVTVDHNLIDGFRSYEGEVRGSDAVEASPRFRGSQDFHLMSGSPAIDRGSPTGAPSLDYDGKRRPIGSGVDIGAYEFGPVRRRPVRR